MFAVIIDFFVCEIFAFILCFQISRILGIFVYFPVIGKINRLYSSFFKGQRFFGSFFSISEKKGRRNYFSTEVSILRFSEGTYCKQMLRTARARTMAIPTSRYMPEGLCLEGSLAERGKVEGFPLGLGKNINPYFIWYLRQLFVFFTVF